jgi:hypothetical protein
MSNLKMVFAIMAIVFIGIIALPYAASLFVGQHVWYDLGEGYGSKCVKCHADIYGELEASANHSSLDGSAIGDVSGAECLVCHRANESITYANASTDTQGQQAHAASTINCGYCHFNSENPTGAPVAGGFGQSDFATAPGNDTGANASHYSFVVQSRDTNILQNESESCVACHTTISIKINFNVTTEATIVVHNSYTETESYWNITSITPSNYTDYTEEK